MRLIVGLGNPGKEYAKTRHNVGFRILDLLAKRLNTDFDRTKFKGEYAAGDLPEKWQGPQSGDGKLLLVKPQTYMNLSGETVLGFSGFYKVEPADVLVVVDDVALPVGALRMRPDGSPGGHNGLKDITARLGTQAFPRLRLGVGGRHAAPGSEKEQQPRDLAGHVLGRFSEAEEEVLKEKLELSADACLYWAGHGAEKTAAKYNSKG
ncbi:MAG TPA: aminoacyl-tRNA hydrolase [Planctomycetota bacterium]|nr:aminoacyl-tRNA hydrolase [Planctomycetota bacterium]